jgi:hypothetical protein
MGVFGFARNPQRFTLSFLTLRLAHIYMVLKYASEILTQITTRTRLHLWLGPHYSCNRTDGERRGGRGGRGGEEWKIGEEGEKKAGKEV